MTDERPGVGGNDDERRLRARLRLVSGLVILGCIVVLVLVDSLGRLLYRPDFHVGDIFLGTLVGALLLILGIEGAARFPWSGSK